MTFEMNSFQTRPAILIQKGTTQSEVRFVPQITILNHVVSVALPGRNNIADNKDKAQAQRHIVTFYYYKA